MCYNKETSIYAFLIGFIPSLFLLLSSSSLEYKIIGSLFIVVSFMQLIDFMIYSDSNCSGNLNNFAGIIGPILNSIQPLILFYYIINSNRFDNNIKFNSSKSYIYIINFIYIVYTIFIYLIYIRNNHFCTNKLIKGRTSWVWYNQGFGYLWSTLYLLTFAINLFYFINKGFNLILFSAILGSVFWFISYINYIYILGEFWCYFVNIIPLIILTLSIISNNKK